MESVEEVEAAADQMAIEAGLDEDQRFHIAMAVREAALTPCCMATSTIPPSKIEVTLEKPAKELRITIADQGRGSIPEKLPDPLAPENLLRGTGRGTSSSGPLWMRYTFDNCTPAPK